MRPIEKKDNSYLADKIMLRAKYLPEKPVVLDCYGGMGKVWHGVESVIGKKIERLGVDKRPDLSDFHIHADNIDFLNSVDLSAFNVVDLDAYGIPARQIQTLYDRKYEGVVFVTFIQSMRGALPTVMMNGLSLGKLYKQAPSVFTRHGWSLFKEWLQTLGVKKIVHRSRNRKHYVAFSFANILPGLS